MPILHRRGASGAATTNVIASSDSHTAALGELEAVALAVAGRDVDGNGDPGEEAVLEVVAELDVVEDGVNGGGLVGEDGVVGVGGDLDGVVAVRRQRLDVVDELLVPEQVAHEGVVAARHGAVLQLRRANVRDDVRVRRAARVVAREEGAELRDTIGVGRLDATEPGAVDVAGIGSAGAVVGGDDARVDTGRVAVPVVHTVSQGYIGRLSSIVKKR